MCFFLHRCVSCYLLLFYNFPVTFKSARHGHLYSPNTFFWCCLEGPRPNIIIYLRSCTHLEIILNSTLPRSSRDKEKHIICILKCWLRITQASIIYPFSTSVNSSKLFPTHLKSESNKFYICHSFTKYKRLKTITWDFVVATPSKVDHSWQVLMFTLVTNVYRNIWSDHMVLITFPLVLCSFDQFQYFFWNWKFFLVGMYSFIKKWICGC